MTAPATESLSGLQLRDLFAAATSWLETNIEAVNAINVFPVPDGDTGTNMYLTMRSTMEEARRCPDDSAGAMLAAMAHGALMGARGNSGVILSQIIRGLARAAETAQQVDAPGLAAGMEEAATAAYRAVTRPTEGTILTVIRDVAEAARRQVGEGEGSIDAVLQTAVDAARESVARTPTLLPVLREAGVVDAGGQGLYVLLEGALAHLRGERLEAAALASGGGVAQDWLSEVEHVSQESPYGYCTEVLVTGRELDADAMREKMLELGDSVLVVGDETAMRVHVHTDDPGAVLSRGAAVGALAQVKVDNIQRQAEEFVGRHEAQPEPQTQAGVLSTVAVAAGEGMRSVFESMGCTRVVSGGPTMNPSTREILEAVESCPADEVIVLPNDKNIIMAAQQASGLTEKRLKVVPSRSIPQGIAALLAMNPEEGADANSQAMEEALGTVRTVEITRAVRSTTLKGVRVEEGQVIAVVDDELKLAAATPEEAVVQALEGLSGAATSLITLYYGADTTEAGATALAERLRERFAGHEVEVLFGGQPHYNYIVSLE